MPEAHSVVEQSETGMRAGSNAAGCEFGLNFLIFMATIVNNPSGAPSMSDRTYIERTSDGDSAGWAIAVILLLAIIALGVFFWVRAHNAYAPASAAPSTINVTVPGTNSGSPGNSGSAGSGSAGGSGNYGSAAPSTSGASGSGSAAGSM